MLSIKEHETCYVIGGGKFIMKYHERIRPFLGAEMRERVLVRMMRSNAFALSMILNLSYAESESEVCYGCIASAFKPDLLVIITNVDGILDNSGRKIEHLSFEEVSSIDVKESPCSYWVVDGTARRIISSERIKTVVGKWRGSLDETVKEATKIGFEE